MNSPVSPSNPRGAPNSAVAGTGQGAALAEQHRLTQAVLASVLIRDVLAVWLTLDLAHVKATWPAVQTAVLALTKTAFAQSVLASTQYYAEARVLAGLAAEIPSLQAPVAMDIGAVMHALDITGPGTLLHDIKIGQTQILAMQHAGVRISGVAMNIVNQAGRENVIKLVQADPKAVGWARKLGPRPCYFCAMLASRGAIYKTVQSAGFRAHEHCMCTAIPGFKKEDITSPSSRALKKAWQRVTKGLSGKDAMNAWRRYWTNEANQQEILHAA